MNSKSRANQRSAADAGLRYVSDTSPGIRRVSRGKSFAFVDSRGKAVKNTKTLARIKSLVIPPAWTDVWICADPNGHLQATGRDARGRKQSRYHPKWREVRDQDKYAHLLDFAHSLPRIRRTVRRHVKFNGMPREKVLAAIVMLMEKTCIRIGNDRYARDNEHFGLTTLEDKHVQVKGSNIHFRFVGKSGKEKDCHISDPRLAKIVAKSQDLPGQQIFEYINGDGKPRDVKSEHVNEYLEEIAGRDITAKDFRTWTGTVLAARALRVLKAASSQTQAKKNIVHAIEQVAEQLGNTRAVCRKCYIHPAILEGYMEGRIVELSGTVGSSGLAQEESAVVAMLHAAQRRRKV